MSGHSAISEYEKIISSVDETTMTPVNKARIKTLMQLQRWSGLSLVDAVCLSKDELKRERKGEFRVVTDRQKTGTLINNVIPAWLGEELIRVKNGNPPSRRIWTRPSIRPSSAFRPSKKLGTMCFSPPGLPDLAAVAAVCAAVSKPVNFMVGIKGKSFSVRELAATGVRRISLATSLYRAAMTGLLNATREVKDSGTSSVLSMSASQRRS